ncbi:hypothetical protein LXA43DRAFT_151204 [Ganoderma leucocontextum]|nr:hypothetical protein LXA43DRAFT_151204 [Ganoderma leucocontextum]
MPVTFKVASQTLYTFRWAVLGTQRPSSSMGVRSRRDNARRCCRALSRNTTSPQSYPTATVSCMPSCKLKYRSHHHLRIRPDDVWLAILVQLNFYINAHAEELRSS